MKAGLYNKSGDLILTWKELISKHGIEIGEDDAIINMGIRFPGFDLVLDNSVKRIFWDSVMLCDVNKIYIPANFEYFGVNLLTNIVMTEIEVDPENPYFSSENGVLFNKGKTELIRYPEEKKGKEYTIPDTVTKIGNESFFNNRYIENINILNANKIGSCAFFSCTNLKNIIMPKINHIDNCAFYNTSLNNLKFPKTLQKIGDKAFKECFDLKHITYDGDEKSFEKINGFEYIYTGNNLTPEDIEYVQEETLEDLINSGKSIIQANKILKENETVR